MKSWETLNEIFVKSEQIQSTSDEIRLYQIGTLRYQVFFCQRILAGTAVSDEQMRQEPIGSFPT